MILPPQHVQLPLPLLCCRLLLAEYGEPRSLTCLLVNHSSLDEMPALFVPRHGKRTLDQALVEEKSSLQAMAPGPQRACQVPRVYDSCLWRLESLVSLVSFSMLHIRLAGKLTNVSCRHFYPSMSYIVYTVEDAQSIGRRRRL